MSVNVIRKNDLAEFTTWKMEAFSNPKPKDQALQDVDQFEQSQRSAHGEGFEKGYREGRARAQSEAEKISALLQSLESDLERFDDMIAENTLQFALALSQAILRTSLKYRPELILSAVRDALAEISPRGETRELHLPPDDIAVISQLDVDLGKAGQLEIVEDAGIERGGCRVSTTQAEVDASLTTRWKRALAALGRTDEWLDESESDASTADASNRPQSNETP